MMNDLYHYEESGLYYIYLMGGVEFSEYDGEECIKVKNADELDKIIGRYILKSGRPFSGCEFKFFRSSLGYGQKEFADLCQVTQEHIIEIEDADNELRSLMALKLMIMFLDDLRGFTNYLDLHKAIFPIISDDEFKKYFMINGSFVKFSDLPEANKDALGEFIIDRHMEVLEIKITKFIKEEIEDFESVGEDRTNSKFFFPINEGHWEKPLALAA